MKFAILPFLHPKQKKVPLIVLQAQQWSTPCRRHHSQTLKSKNLPLSLSNTPTLIFCSNKITHIQRTAWPTISFINASLCNVTLHTYTTDCHRFSAMFRALHLHITQHLLAPAATLSKNISASIIYMKPPNFCTAYLKSGCRWHLQIHKQQATPSTQTQWNLDDLLKIAKVMAGQQGTSGVQKWHSRFKKKNKTAGIKVCCLFPTAELLKLQCKHFWWKPDI